MQKLAPFRNEPYTDFSTPANRQAIAEALAQVRAQLGREYPLLIDGKSIQTGDLLTSVNPSDPAEIIGVHHRATADLAKRAVDSAYTYFSEYSAIPEEDRIGFLVRAADIIRRRKLEFDAWLVLEAGKTWPEAEAEVSEAVDFCEYYAREMQRFSGPIQPDVQLPGERGELRYLPLGVGVVIPPWNFPLAILVGMTVASLVAGNTAIVKPSSETPTIAAKFAEVLLEAGFPAKSFCLLTGSGAAVGDVIVEHPKTRFIAFTGSRDVGLRINELAAKPSPARSGSSASSPKWAVKTPSSSTPNAISIKPSKASPSPPSATPARNAPPAPAPSSTPKSTTRSSKSCKPASPKSPSAKSEDTANYMGPVISAGAQRTILQYIEIGKTEGRLLPVGVERPIPMATSSRPPSSPTSIPRPASSRKKSSDPSSPSPKPSDFDHALATRQRLAVRPHRRHLFQRPRAPRSRPP